MFNGTGANVVALQAVTDRWGAVIAAESARTSTSTSAVRPSGSAD